MPSAFDLTRFISSSIVFMSRLSEVTIYFDNKCLAKLTKASGIPRELGIPKGLNNVSPRKTMRVKALTLVRKCPPLARYLLFKLLVYSH